MSLVSLMRFIVNHPARERVFKGLEFRDIVNALVESLNSGGLLVIESSSEPKQIEGFVAAIVSKEYKLLHVSAILTNSSPGVVKKMLEALYLYYPDFDIQATRHGVLMRYKNTQRLVRLLERIAK